jgi:actin-related protein
MENKLNLLESEVDLKDLIVIDNGTDSIKIGYSGENHPEYHIKFSYKFLKIAHNSS